MLMANLGGGGHWRRAAALLFLPAFLFAQSPGVIAVSLPAEGQRTTWVRGTAGVNEDPDKTVCTMTVNRSLDGLTSNMHLECYLGIGAAQRRVAFFDISIPAGALTVCPSRGQNKICLTVVRGYPVPDHWEMVVNDPQNGGDSKNGVF